jgi:preprotein translocase subunit SecG
MLYTALVIVDVILAAALIALILLQHGKGADAGAAFGSGSSGTVFGAAGGASVLQKITTWIAVGFFVVTMGLSIAAKDRVATATQQKKPTSVVQEQVPDQEEAAQSSSIGFIPEVDVTTEESVEIPETAESMPAIELPELPSNTDDQNQSSEAPAIPAE